MPQVRQGGFLISKIHQLSGRIFTKKLKMHNIDEINQAQGKILFFLWQNDGISINDVGKMTGLQKSTLTSMLDRLESAGYIMRVHSKEDRRKILIKVTDKDLEIRGVYEQMVAEMSNLFYKDFSEKEIDDFEGYLRRVFENLSSYTKK